MSLRELQEKRRDLAAKIRKVAEKHDEEKGWACPDDRAEYDKLNAEYDANMAEMERATESDAIQNRLSQLNGADNAAPAAGGLRPDYTQKAQGEKFATALAGWMNFQVRGAAPEAQVEACRTLGVNLFAKEFELPTLPTNRIKRFQDVARGSHQTQWAEKMNGAMTTGTGATGGHLIPDETLSTALEVNMLAHGPMRMLSQIIQTTSGEPFRWPTANDTGNSSSILAESTTVGAGVTATLAQVSWGAHKMIAGPIFVPYELLEDSVVDLPAVLGEMLGEQFGRGTNALYTTGTGSSQPTGVVLASGLGVTAASPTAIVSDEVIKLAHSVDPAYRAGAGYMAHDNIILAVRLLKHTSGTNSYIWQEGLQLGQPDRLNGYPLYTNQAMQSSVTTGTKTMLFGNFSKYKIRRVNGVRLYRLVERYRDVDQDAFFAFIREDGNLLNAGTNPVKHLIQA